MHANLWGKWGWTIERKGNRVNEERKAEIIMKPARGDMQNDTNEKLEYKESWELKDEF